MFNFHFIALDVFCIHCFCLLTFKCFLEIYGQILTCLYMYVTRNLMQRKQWPLYSDYVYCINLITWRISCIFFEKIVLSTKISTKEQPNVILRVTIHATHYDVYLYRKTQVKSSKVPITIPEPFVQ